MHLANSAGQATSGDWWPTLLRFVAKDDLWAEAKVPVSRLFSVPNGEHHPGEFRSFSALVPVSDLQAVTSFPRGLSHEVSASGPHPWEGAAPSYDPAFWISASHLPRDRYEPLVLSWTSNNQTVLLPDPRFLMTYGLMPRALSNGKTAYDDPQLPMFDVVEVDAPSIWDFPNRTKAVMTIARDYLQDYLTLRGVALFEVYYACASGPADDDSLEKLAGEESLDFELPDRTINLQLSPFRRDGSLTAQVWGARLIAMPHDLPITADPLEKSGLLWPGYESPISHADAMRLRVGDYAYVDDSVLAPYEGKPGFSINPETGSVSFGHQWSVGFCERVGRNTIRLELKKLYEGAPTSAIRTWHAHALAPVAGITSAEARSERNVGSRARDIVRSWANIGVALHDLAFALDLKAYSPESFVKLDREKLDYYGWATPNSVEPITRHIPAGMDMGAFLQRCVALNNLLAEGIGQSPIRQILEKLTVTANEHSRWKGLKLLNEVVCMAQVAEATGLSLITFPDLVRQELKATGTQPAQPLETLFALYDLRIVASHNSSNLTQELENKLGRLGIETVDYAGGFGFCLDRIYDALGAELSRVAGILTAVLKGK
jgi:hypothetical protein